VTVTGRELSWITAGTLLSVAVDGHRYSGKAVERLAVDRWRVEVLCWGGAEAGFRYTPGGVYECGRSGSRRIESLLGPPFAGGDA
jgi:hypothetical protein